MRRKRRQRSCNHGSSLRAETKGGIVEATFRRDDCPSDYFGSVFDGVSLDSSDLRTAHAAYERAQRVTVNRMERKLSFRVVRKWHNRGGCPRYPFTGHAEFLFSALSRRCALEERARKPWLCAQPMSTTRSCESYPGYDNIL